MKETVDNERHITENSARSDFWAGLQSSGKQMLNELLRTLASLFAKSWDKGKDKYMKFQLEWQQGCSVFLLPPDKSLSDVGVDHVDLAHLQQRWVGYCEGKSVDKDVRDAVMISVFTTIFSQMFSNQYCTQVTQHLKTQILFITGFVELLLQTCYMLNIINAKPASKSKESHIPEKLKYRDRGFMYN